jgi:hypothetical protein
MLAKPSLNNPFPLFYETHKLFSDRQDERKGIDEVGAWIKEIIVNWKFKTASISCFYKLEGSLFGRI